MIGILKDQRLQLGMTQSELAHRSKISIPMIQLIESGKANPSLSVVGKLSDVLGLKITIQKIIPWMDRIQPHSPHVEEILKSKKGDWAILPAQDTRIVPDLFERLILIKETKDCSVYRPSLDLFFELTLEQTTESEIQDVYQMIQYCRQNNFDKELTDALIYFESVESYLKLDLKTKSQIKKLL